MVVVFVSVLPDLVLSERKRYRGVSPKLHPLSHRGGLQKISGGYFWKKSFDFTLIKVTEKYMQTPLIFTALRMKVHYNNRKGDNKYG